MKPYLIISFVISTACYFLMLFVGFDQSGTIPYLFITFGLILGCGMIAASIAGTGKKETTTGALIIFASLNFVFFALMFVNFYSKLNQNNAHLFLIGAAIPVACFLIAAALFVSGEKKTKD